MEYKVDTSFIEAIASPNPTPGGGGAAAYCAALGSALCSMVGNLSLGKKSIAAYNERIAAALSDLERLRGELLGLVRRDEQAFAPLALAYRMPQETLQQRAHRHEAIQAALIEAIDAPLAIMRACAGVIDASDVLAHHGTRSAASDVATGVCFAKAALQGAVLNVYVNAILLEDKQLARDYTLKADSLVACYVPRADELYTFVLKEIQ